MWSWSGFGYDCRRVERVAKHVYYAVGKLVCTDEVVVRERSGTSRRKADKRKVKEDERGRKNPKP